MRNFLYGSTKENSLIFFGSAYVEIMSSNHHKKLQGQGHLTVKKLRGTEDISKRLGKINHQNIFLAIQ